ncbi:pyruvate, phosphate dikinase [Candidatus Kryptonium thompsonii]|nr:pyruvate, phosphate dikinase [Candidatus Kryptonium thompsoni]
MKWADEVRRLRIRTNADLPKQAEVAVAFGAEGIGLTRTEHMFFEGDRIISMRKMILADTKEEREAALNELLPLQRADFYGIFKVMGDRPVTIRTLDPPLHEFLPHTDEEIKEFSEKTGIPEEKIRRKIAELKEFNPMLGFRGCRLGIVYPEITAMQTRAIIEAACDAAKEGIKVKPEIMIPLVGHVNELKNQEKIVREVAEKVMEEKGVKVEYSVGTMIEVPRAAITADEIATVAEFFSFGTNDLTQMGMGLSRDDYEKFIYKYLDFGIYDKDPFQTIDVKGIGELMRIGVEKGRSVRPNLKIGICGEHGGDPATIEFCHRIGLDYVSCSPYRVPIARLAAARAALLYDGIKKVSVKKTNKKAVSKVKQRSKGKAKVKAK